MRNGNCDLINQGTELTRGRGWRVLAALLTLLLLLPLLLSCGADETPDTPYRPSTDASSAEEPKTDSSTAQTPTRSVAVQGVRFPYPELTMKVGERVAIRAQIYPENATNQNIGYKVTDDSVISYEDGMLQALSKGQEVLIAESEEDKYRARLTVTVLPPDEPTTEPPTSQTSDPYVAVTGVQFSDTELTMKVGERVAIRAQICPENATNRSITYKTTDDGVISYENGMLQALSKGQAELIAESAEGGYRARLTVTVSASGGDQSDWLLKETPDAGMDYQNKLIFLGDSTTAGMIPYAVLPGGENTKQVWRGAAGNTITFLYVENVSILYPETGESMTIIEAVKKAKPEYLVITLGVTGGVSLNIGKDSFIGLYEWLLGEIFKTSPSTKVIVQSIFPVEENRNTPAGDYTKITIENIELYNGWIKEMVEKFFTEGKNVRYSDVYPELLGSNGYMDPAFGNGDGLHIGPAGYAVILNYLRTHAWL